MGNFFRAFEKIPPPRLSRYFAQRPNEMLEEGKRHEETQGPNHRVDYLGFDSIW